MDCGVCNFLHGLDRAEGNEDTSKYRKIIQHVEPLQLPDWLQEEAPVDKIVNEAPTNHLLKAHGNERTGQAGRFSKSCLEQRKADEHQEDIEYRDRCDKKWTYIKNFTIYAVHHSLHVSVHTSSSRNFTVQTPLQREARTGELANEWSDKLLAQGWSLPQKGLRKFIPIKSSSPL